MAAVKVQRKKHRKDSTQKHIERPTRQGSAADEAAAKAERQKAALARIAARVLVQKKANQLPHNSSLKKKKTAT